MLANAQHLHVDNGATVLQPLRGTAIRLRSVHEERAVLAAGPAALVDVTEDVEARGRLRSKVDELSGQRPGADVLSEPRSRGIWGREV